MPRRLWRTKPHSSSASVRSGLKRVFGPWQLIALGVGVTVGAGLFSITGVAAGQYAGPAVTLSFLLAAIACSFAGLCYAELAGLLPVAGSAYSYAYASMGEFVAWVIGWDLMLEYTVAAATVASSWSGYLNSLLKSWGLWIDPRFMAPSLAPVRMPDGTMARAWFNAPSVFIIFIVTLLMLKGTRESSRLNAVIVTIKMLVVAGVIAACLPFIHSANYHPFLPPNTGEYGHFGFSGILRAAGMIFFAYVGFDIVSTTALDTYDPQKNLPRSILTSLLICAIIYAVFSFVLVGVVDYHALANDPNPVATAIDKVHLPWLGALIKIGITLGYVSVIYGMLLGQSRVALAMGQDGLIPPQFSRLHPRTQTPVFSHLLSGSVAALLAACLPISLLGKLTSIGTLLAFVIVCAGVIALRLRAPHLPRRFRVPGGTFLIPVLGILCCGTVMVCMDRLTWLRLFCWFLIGAVVYFTYSLRHSKLARKPPSPPESR
ncbi:APC family permease [Oecophyllibacter saccharovorans]|uniref:APC family permease n=1 Tax=Oecophyllibacter saccharovorans TaxID=2558360 RepID=UPI00116BAC5D|nr:amino acid permease [Oecophyllibacter saccharovorans]TPW34642.1 amino acid permease [Oecophyllibacter saccharovorans]